MANAPESAGNRGCRCVFQLGQPPPVQRRSGFFRWPGRKGLCRADRRQGGSRPAQPTIPGHHPARRCSRADAAQEALAAGAAARTAGGRARAPGHQAWLWSFGAASSGSARATTSGEWRPFCSSEGRASCGPPSEATTHEAIRGTPRPIAGSGWRIEPGWSQHTVAFIQAGPHLLAASLPIDSHRNPSGPRWQGRASCTLERQRWFHLWRPRCSGSSVGISSSGTAGEALSSGCLLRGLRTSS